MDSWIYKVFISLMTTHVLRMKACLIWNHRKYMQTGPTSFSSWRWEIPTGWRRLGGRWRNVLPVSRTPRNSREKFSRRLTGARLSSPPTTRTRSRKCTFPAARSGKEAEQAAAAERGEKFQRERERERDVEALLPTASTATLLLPARSQQSSGRKLSAAYKLRRRGEILPKWVAEVPRH